MRRPGFKLALAGIAIATSAAGCSTTAVGSAVPTSTTSVVDSAAAPGGTSTRTSHGAPKVASPLDVSRFLTQPCEVLSPSQLHDLNLPLTGKPDVDSAIAKNVGPGCTWSNEIAGNLVGTSFITGNPNGLDDLYRGHQQGQFRAYWIETTVEGYPAIFHDATDARPSGTCNLGIGVSDTIVFRVGEHGGRDEGEKSCDRAKQVASAAMRTLKGGG